MVDENSVNAQQISECAVKRLKSHMCGQLLCGFRCLYGSFWLNIHLYIS